MISQTSANVLLVLLLFFALYSTSSHAIDVNRTLPIEIESDSAIIDDSQGLSTYRGNVVISQGSTKLAADNITVFAQDRSVTQIVANGAPATFNQTDSGTDESTTGQAQQITYKANEAILIFSGDAKLAQATNSFAGDRIEYDIMRKAIRAKGDESSGTRVKIQYFPSQASDPVKDASPAPEKNNSEASATPNSTQDNAEKQ